MKPMHSMETESSGLGSLHGIRWLLAVGALVLAVSVYRLVESQWAGMAVTAQYLTLVAGTFGVYGAGKLLRNRLRLPIAGSALQLLFSVLVPVLSWGAAYSSLLSAPGGAIVYGVSVVALLAAFRRCLAESLDYDGRLYPAAFGLLTIALPVLSLADVTGWGDILTVIGLGAVFHVGSRHINRFLFHRDRRDGIDRPVHLLPFVALTVLYAASASVLEIPEEYVALPIAIVGAVFVTTGEEYYRALVRSLRAQPSRWPKRSAWLLAVGFSLLVVAGQLALLDGSGRVPAIVLCALAALLFRWSFRYHNVPAHLFAMLALVVGYVFLPALMPAVAVEALSELTDRLGLVPATAKISFAQLGLGIVFAVLGRFGAPRVHAVGASVHLIGVVAVSAFAGAKVVAPLALVLAAFSVTLTRRSEWAVAANIALGATVLAWGGSYGMELLAIVMIAVVALVKRSPYLTVPCWLWAGVVAVSGILSFETGGGSEVLSAGALLLALGHRRSLPLACVAGLGAVSLGIHGSLLFSDVASMVVLVVATQGMFAVSVGLRRWASETWELAAELSIVSHGVLGVAWLVIAIAASTVAVTIEPVIVALIGGALLWPSLRDRDESEAAWGIGVLVAYGPLHLAALGLIETLPVLLLLALAGLLAARALVPRWLAPAIERLFRSWRVIAVIAALGLAGIEAAALTVVVVLTVVLSRKTPYRSLLLLLAHGLILVAGTAGHELFALALVEAMTSKFPLFAALALGWILWVEARREKTLSLWVTGLECLVVSGFFLGFFPAEIFTAWDFGALVVIAAAFAARHAFRSFRLENAGHAWAMQAWLGLGVLVGHFAGWVSFGSGRAAYVLLAAGVLQYAASALWERSLRARALALSSSFGSQALVLGGGIVALGRLQTWPLFLASVFYLVLASRETRRIAPSILAAAFLGAGLFAVASSHGVGVELYSLAPGFMLLALASLLSDEMGPRWSRHVFTAGASFIYATPVLALYGEITWTWQAVLLVLTVGFGAASFWLRSRPLLTLSTAALVIDLVCFVIVIRATEPILLWVGGVLLGVALMGLAAYLEHRREGLAQQIRVFGRELAGWY